ncbi:synaptotagmin-1 isoform X1 [Nematostella vectensis]|uniref:synaptotagmin-1 isoform X1 n=1 Tax=Nematostella vectensis TaxID=45351 RepID=UPI0020773748|nr:synaptotagmin-1 isoform X1 [Nematostella vectensis]XP_032218385.2 synaptotagmin-1 isoform X1 [Nematostella vectensis]XP_048579238.1 synaptotagmin-1 isoform X1 [Nematostella vectensis]
MPSVWVLIILGVTCAIILSAFAGLLITTVLHYRRSRRDADLATNKPELPVIKWPSLRVGALTAEYAQSPIDAQYVAIQPRTYHDLQKSEEQLLSENSAGSTSEVPERRKAKLKFTLQYNAIEEALTVKLLQAKNLSILTGTNDVTYYVTLKILPLSHRSFQSSAVKGETDTTTFEDSFEFKIPNGELPRQNIKFTVRCFDRFSHHEIIGELRVNLCEQEPRGLSLSREVLLYREINEVQKPDRSVGEVMVSLGYLRLTEKLAVVLVRARDLQPLKSGYKPDPYADVSICHAGRYLRHKQSHTLLQECNPIFNETLTFHIPHGILHEVSIVISIRHDSGEGEDDVILGQVLLGPETTGIQFEQWNDMRLNNKPIARWHKLNAF